MVVINRINESDSNHTIRSIERDMVLLSLLLLLLLLIAQLLINNASSSSSQGLSIALMCRDGVILSASTFLSLAGVHAHADYEWIRILGDDRLITVIGNDDDFYKLSNSKKKNDKNVVIALQGDPIDCEELFTILQRVDLRHRASFGIGMGVKALAYFGSKVIASNLRKRQMNVNCFIGGWYHCNDNKGKPILYYLDSVGALKEVSYGSQGKEMALVLSLLDRKNMDIGKGTSGSGMHKISVQLQLLLQLQLQVSKQCKSISDATVGECIEIIKSCWKVMLLFFIIIIFFFEIIIIIISSSSLSTGCSDEDNRPTGSKQHPPINR